ncbi:MAG: mechanosensitive ion channel family protein [Candidatus Poribacteria bacterium]|nr:mechanosensitive ion channel family protein [Candidatus Poribacteria bacterium]MDE0502850.1 mechanosensitive ion channel family protein [Candidatus Poribacteria bacterium]
MEWLSSILNQLLTLFWVSDKRGILLSIVTIIGLLVIRAVLTRPVKAYVYKRALKQENAANFMTTWKFFWFAIIAIFGVIGLSGSIKTLGISVGFLGMLLGWSLQAPVTGIAAWLMLILKRPFKIGQRVIIAGVTGDVVDITLTHVILNQVGGTVVGEERSGRGILIPNAILFSQTITNYTLDVEYILSEVPVRITFQSDWDEAEQILLNAARKIVTDAIRETGEEPFIRAELFDAGVLMRLRYNTRPAEYAQNINDIVKIIHAEFRKSDKVEFCYPHSEVLYSLKEPPPPITLSENRSSST